MVKRLAIGIALVFAVFPATIHPPQACAMSMPAVQRMPCGDCCATMKSCVLPQKDQAHPTTAATANQQSIGLIAPAVQPLLVPPPVTSPQSDRSFAETILTSSSRLAVLCTFLI